MITHFIKGEEQCLIKGACGKSRKESLHLLLKKKSWGNCNSIAKN